MNLPSLSTDYALTPQQCADFKTDGFALLRGVVAPEELAPYRDIITAMTNEFAKTYAPMEKRDTYGKAFIQYINLWELSEAVAQYSFARRFAKIAADLMGVDGVRMYHDQALYKEPGGGITPWHQDQQYWPLSGAKCVTLWMPLVDCTKEMGTMRFARGSQAMGYLGPANISDDSEIKFDALVKERGYEVISVGDMTAGDATFHDGWTLHGAPGNTDSSRTREVMTIIFVEDDATVQPHEPGGQSGDHKRFLPELGVGESIACKFTPLLYHKTQKP
jgi:ectoine hydroxylase-related dioxygenase (phytanoyl-CoA dioxygenase family)